MNKLLVILAAVFALTACSPLPVKKDIVYVDKPIPYVPKPPDVPVFDSHVDLLTLDDAKDPGKVGQAYKYDMTQLRSLQKIYQMILDQYRASSQNFDEVNKAIDKLITDSKGANAAP